jgi:predicted transcriptional regulator
MNIPDDLREHLAALVRTNLHGRTQKWLADQVGITQKHLSRVLNGHAEASVQLWDMLLTTLKENTP